MFLLTNTEQAVEVGLLVRAIMYAILFTGGGIVLWDAAKEATTGTKSKMVKFLAGMAFALGAVNVFMAVEWFLLYFS